MERAQKAEKNQLKAMTSSLSLFAPRSIWLPHVIAAAAGKRAFLSMLQAASHLREARENRLFCARQPGAGSYL